MLASLLPGLRDLRTPLAVGYLWVVALWLLLHDWWPESVEAATGPTKFLYELSAPLGSAATLAALSFVVYLLGSMLRWRHLFSPLGVVVAGFEHEPLRFGGWRWWGWRLLIVFRRRAQQTTEQLLTLVSTRLREENVKAVLASETMAKSWTSLLHC